MHSARPCARAAAHVGKNRRPFLRQCARLSERRPEHGFCRRLARARYVEGRNLTIDWRYADGRPERLAAAAAELVQLKVALIVAGGPASMHSARAATTTIPIVAIGGVDPVAEGWAQSLARPDANTGASHSRQVQNRKTSPADAKSTSRPSLPPIPRPTFLKRSSSTRAPRPPRNVHCRPMP